MPPGGWQQPIPQSAVPSHAMAGWGRRLGAYVIDFLIVSIPALLLLAVFTGGLIAVGDDNDGFFALLGALILTVFVLAVVALLYASLLMMRGGERNGQTWGKQLLGIRVVRLNGRPFSFGSAALREVVLKILAVAIASSFIPLIPWFLNFFWPLWDDENRALHDMVVSTRVVKA